MSLFEVISSYSFIYSVFILPAALGAGEHVLAGGFLRDNGDREGGRLVAPQADLPPSMGGGTPSLGRPKSQRLDDHKIG